MGTPRRGVAQCRAITGVHDCAIHHPVLAAQTAIKQGAAISQRPFGEARSRLDIHVESPQGGISPAGKSSGCISRKTLAQVRAEREEIC